MSATVCLNDGDTHNSPVEATEAKSPIIVEHAPCARTPAVAGKFRGGLGVAQTKCACAGRRRSTPMWSGRSARRGDFTAARTRWRIEFRFRGRTAGRKISHRQNQTDGNRCGRFFLRRDCRRRWFLESAGARCPERVLADVRAGYVSLEAARRDYGVVIQQPDDVSNSMPQRPRSCAGKITHYKFQIPNFRLGSRQQPHMGARRVLEYEI